MKWLPYGGLMAMRHLARAVAVAPLSLFVVSPALAEGAVTPLGPATVRGSWLGAVPAVSRGPEVLVGWSATVLPGGNSGRVRLRVLRSSAGGTVVGSGPVEWLPAAAGTYRFGVSPGIPIDGGVGGFALDQQVGGHAIVRTHAAQPQLGPYADPARLYAVDVFRPPLAAGAVGVPYSERRLAEELLVSGAIERDIDRDRLGDQTQDVGDLRLSDAYVARSAGRKVLIVARIRNVGRTVRQMPFLLARRASPGVGWVCNPLRPLLSQTPPKCPGPAIAPGARADLKQKFSLNDSRSPKLVELASEGPDSNPADNRARLKPWLRLRAVNRSGLRFSLTSARRGRAKVVVRVAGMRIVRKVRFRASGRRTLDLLPRGLSARGRLAAARERPGRLRAAITATMSIARTSLRAQL